MLEDFVAPKARPLPVYLLVDTSGSMQENDNIVTLNRAMEELIASLVQEEHFSAEIHVAVITFGGREATVRQPLAPAREVKWTPVEARGHTPLGHAIELACRQIEDPQIVSRRSYLPTIVVVSDGVPNEERRYMDALKELAAAPRASRAQRLALFIGSDQEGEDSLRAFLNNPRERLFKASDAKQIHDFFRMVEQSVTRRSRSVNPNSISDEDVQIV